jgi:hypothetical protein
MAAQKKAAAPVKVEPAAPVEAVEDELQALADVVSERGYVGSTPDRHPNSAYSLVSGPDAPVQVPDSRTRLAG